MKETKEKVEVWVLQWMERPQVVEAIRVLRDDWENAVDGESLYRVEGNVGLILDDIARLLGLTPEECTQALGHTLE